MDISVIIPIYNSEKNLSKCLESLRVQDFKNCEFICINDGSIDLTESICKFYCSMDNRFVLINIKHSGPSIARNIGLEYATGKYICFVDSDDCLAYGALSIMHNEAVKRKLDILIHSADIICESGKCPTWIPDQLAIKPRQYNNFNPKLIFKKKGCRPFLWLHFIRREIIEKYNIRFDESLFIGEDQVFEIEYLSKSKRVYFTNMKLYLYYVNIPNSLMTTYSNQHMLMIQQHIAMTTIVIMCLQEYKLKKIIKEWILDTIYPEIIRVCPDLQKTYAELTLELLSEEYCGRHLLPLKNHNYLKFIMEYTMM